MEADFYLPASRQTLAGALTYLEGPAGMVDLVLVIDVGD